MALNYDAGRNIITPGVSAAEHFQENWHHARSGVKRERESDSEEMNEGFLKFMWRQFKKSRKESDDDEHDEEPSVTEKQEPHQEDLSGNEDKIDQ